MTSKSEPPAMLTPLAPKNPVPAATTAPAHAMQSASVVGMRLRLYAVITMLGSAPAADLLTQRLTFTGAALPL